MGEFMEIFLSRSQGFCAGVAYAVALVEGALKKCGTPLYVYHEIVHNTHVVNDFRKRGVIFVDDIADVPEGRHVVFSAHGVPPPIVTQAQSRNLRIIDATCPLVKKVHKEAENFSNKQYHVILIGHKGHQEIVGTSGYVNPALLHIVEKLEDIEKLKIPPGAAVAYLTQTTLSVDETQGIIKRLREKFPRLSGPAREDICYSTQRRQDAIKELARVVDFMVVCGSSNSSNSNRLKETAEKAGAQTVLIDNAEELDIKLLEGKKRIGLSSGASVPRLIVDQVVQKICKAYPNVLVHDSPDNADACFPIPKI